MKKCPECAEQIQDEATKCKHCGSKILLLTRDQQALVELRKANLEKAIQLGKEWTSQASQRTLFGSLAALTGLACITLAGMRAYAEAIQTAALICIPVGLVLALFAWFGHQAMKEIEAQVGPLGYTLGDLQNIGDQLAPPPTTGGGVSIGIGIGFPLE